VKGGQNISNSGAELHGRAKRHLRADAIADLILWKGEIEFDDAMHRISGDRENLQGALREDFQDSQGGKEMSAMPPSESFSISIFEGCRSERKRWKRKKSS